MPFGQQGVGFRVQPLPGGQQAGIGGLIGGLLGNLGADAIEALIRRFGDDPNGNGGQMSVPQFPATIPPGIPGLSPPIGGGGVCPPLFRAGASVLRMSPVPWFPIQAPNGKWFFFGHLGTPTFSKLKARRRHHHHSRKR